MNKSLRLEAVIVFYLVVQSAYVWIERSIFWGEILLVVLFFYGIREKYTYMKHHTVFLVFLIYFSCVLPFIAWTIGSLHGDFNFLYSLRHLTYFFYGAFAIFSFINAHKIVYILGRAVPIMTLFVLYVPDPPRDLFFGLTLVGFAANPHLRRFWIVFAFYFIFTRFFTVGLSPLDISRGESSSDFVIGILETIIIALAFFGRRAWLYGSGKIRNLRILIVSGFVVLLIFYSSLAFIANQSNLFHAKGYSEIEVTYSLSNDNNTVWRMAYWGAMLSRLIDNPMGIGIGRPFLPLGVGDGLFYFGQENSDPKKTIEYEHYFVSSHNSFVSMLTLCGLFFLFPITIVVWHLPPLVYRSLAARIYDKETGVLLLSLFMNATIALVVVKVHVGLESPIHSGILWSAFGLWLRFALDWGNAGFILINKPSQRREIPLSWG